MTRVREADNPTLDDPAGRPDLGPDLLRLLGGRLCLDFTNTVEDRTGRRPVDCLGDYADLARWGRQAGGLGPETVRALLTEAERQPETSRAVFALAIALREAIYRVFRAVAHGKPPPKADLETLAVAYLDALARARLAETGGGFGWVWAADGRDLTRPLWPVACSAIEVLTEADHGRVKQCPGPGDDCGRLFLDSSKNGSRRWCSMDGCGSQAKMRRRYARAKARGVRREA